jgi:hypothetical protein
MRNVIGSLLVIASVAGCGSRPTPRIGLAENVVRPARSVVLFFVDGLDRTRFDAMRAQGRLPNLERRFVLGGVGVEHAIVSMPSVTYANAVSIITGRFPGHHGVLGNQWFDRRTLAGRDYGTAATYRSVNDDFVTPTLYEMLDDHFTVNVQNHTRRGATVTIDNRVSSGVAWFRHRYSEVDARVGRRITVVGREAGRAGRWPSVVMNYFPGLDEVGHRYGPDSRAYADALGVVDVAIGRIVDAVETERPADATWYVLLTDHGLIVTRPERTFDLVGWLREQWGLRVHAGPVDGRRADGYDAIAITGADRRCAIHLRGPQGWHEPALLPDDVGALSALPAVGLVCRRLEPMERGGTRSLALAARMGRVLVDAGDGCFIIERRDDQVRLIAPAGSDPLGYRADAELAAFVDAGWHTSRAWLAATAATDYPDFVPQVVEMFDDPRAGDIVVFAADDWSFDDRYAGGHGSCLAADMRVPLYFAGPGLLAGARIDHARLVDVMPTVLDLLGESARLDSVPPIDGVSLVEQLRGHFPQ